MGIDSFAGRVDVLSVVELLLVAVGYAAAPVIANTVLAEVPSMGVIAVSVTVVAVLYLPWTAAGFASGGLSPEVLAAVVVLGLVCTALAFVLFFRLIALAGPVRATVITFINPAVAIGLGLVILGEPLTSGMALGFPLVLLGVPTGRRGPLRLPHPDPGRVRPRARTPRPHPRAIRGPGGRGLPAGRIRVLAAARSSGDSRGPRWPTPPLTPWALSRWATSHAAPSVP